MDIEGHITHHGKQKSARPLNAGGFVYFAELLLAEQGNIDKMMLPGRDLSS